MTLLLLSVAALAMGPVLGLAVRRSALATHLIDGFVVVGVLALTLGHILPHTVAAMGAWTWPAWFVGLWLPTLLHGGTPCGGHAPRGMLAVAIFALGLHALLDGVALVQVATPEFGLAAAVVLHRLLEGVSVWWLTRKVGPLQRVGALGGVGAATVLGYALGERAVGVGLGPGVALIQAAVAGSLLHVLARHPQLEGSGPSALALPLRLTSSVGGLAAAALFVLEGEALEPHGAHEHAHGTLPHVFFAHVGWLVLVGLATVALGHAAAARVPYARLQSLLAPARGAILGAVAGAGSALCSCGVVPLWRQRLEQKRPLRESVAFLLAAPALGPLSLVLSLGTLGLTWTVLRLVSVVSIAALAAALIAPHSDTRSSESLVSAESRATPCARGHARSAWLDGLAYAGGDVLAFAAPWLVAGLLGAQLLAEMLAPGWVTTCASSAWALALVLVVLAPLYVAAEATTLLAVVLVELGANTALTLGACLSSGMLSWVSTAELAARLGRIRAGLLVLTSFAGILVPSLGLFWCEASTVTVHDVVIDGAQDWPLLSWLARLGLLLVVGATLRQGVRGSLDQIAAPNRHARYGAHHDHA